MPQSLNIDKTKFMLFTPKNFSLCTDDIVINQIKIQEVKETNCLGVIIDNFDNETLLSLYHCFVYPYLPYCIHEWGKAYNTHLNDLVVLYNKAMRIISGVLHISPSTLWFFTCITDIGAHKPWLLGPFVIHDFPMYYIPNVTKIFLICMFVMLYLYVLHGKKTYWLSLSLLKSCSIRNF